MQIQGANVVGQDVKYKGMFQTISLITKEEGFPTLFKGLTAGL